MQIPVHAKSRPQPFSYFPSWESWEPRWCLPDPGVLVAALLLALVGGVCNLYGAMVNQPYESSDTVKLLDAVIPPLGSAVATMAIALLAADRVTQPPTRRGSDCRVRLDGGHLRRLAN